MLKSLYLYSKYFGNTFLHRRESELVLNDFKRYKRLDFRHIPKADPQTRDKATHQAVHYLLRAQEMMQDDGFGSYHLVNGWSASYPETSGYIIPSLMQYSFKYNKAEVRGRLFSAADWLLSIQKKEGGWQGGRIGENKAAVVFNTAQIIRGMIEVYHQTSGQKYLDAAIKAADWLCSIQEEQGYWKSHALMNRARVYDSYVDAPLVSMWKITKNSKYQNAARKNLEWIVHQKQKQNGWFYDCDNTVKRNDKPILHTIAYTIDGLLDCASMLKNEEYLQAGKKAADVLLEKFLQHGYLNGRYDENWKGSEYILCTGCAQMAINWFKLANILSDHQYYVAGQKMLDLLIYIQNRGRFDIPDTNGAMQGSFPLWGRYEPFAFPNWATKYFLDALLMEKDDRS